jgi:hypothetical protein
MCGARDVTPLQRRLELVNMDDACSSERCGRCDSRFGYGRAVISSGQLVHAGGCP